MFALFPCCCCSGRIKEGAVVEIESGEEIFTLQRSLFCCWPIFSVFPYCPCAEACRDVYSCHKFCGADFLMDLKTPVYGPYLDMNTPTEPIGYVVQTLSLIHI